MPVFTRAGALIAAAIIVTMAGAFIAAHPPSPKTS